MSGTDDARLLEFLGQRCAELTSKADAFAFAREFAKRRGCVAMVFAIGDEFAVLPVDITPPDGARFMDSFGDPTCANDDGHRLGEWPDDVKRKLKRQRRQSEGGTESEGTD